jgi:hypothetical protein
MGPPTRPPKIPISIAIVIIPSRSNNIHTIAHSLDVSAYYQKLFSQYSVYCSEAFQRTDISMKPLGPEPISRQLFFVISFKAR